LDRFEVVINVFGLAAYYAKAVGGGQERVVISHTMQNSVHERGVDHNADGHLAKP